MITSPIRARQPLRQAWTCERLLRECTIALGQAIDNSTWKNYRSALNSYLNFIKLHNFPLEPTPNTLSLFTVYMCHHIKPTSVATYLSGICQQLEPYFPPNPRRSQLCSGTLYIAGLQTPISNPNFSQMCLNFGRLRNNHQCINRLRRLQ